MSTPDIFNNEDAKTVLPERDFTFTLRGLLIAVACCAVSIWGCNQVRLKIIAPRVTAEEVQEYLGNNLPIGSARAEVENWLVGRYEHHQNQGQGAIQFWITDTGPRSPFAMIPDDIRIQLHFDSSNRLKTIDAVTESRF